MRIAISAMLVVGLVASASAATLDEMQLLDAAHYCRIDEMGALLDTGVDVDARSTGGQTPLIMAAYGQWLEGIELLLDLGADPDAEDDPATRRSASQGSTAMPTSRPFWPMRSSKTDPTMKSRSNRKWRFGSRSLRPSRCTSRHTGQTRRAACASRCISPVSRPCGYFSGGQWIMDYSCTAQYSECNRACEAGQPTSCTNTFRPWGGR